MNAKERILAILDEQPDEISFQELLRVLVRATDQGVDADLIAERLCWSPRERLQYLLDMLAFEKRAHLAPVVPSRPRPTR